MSAGLAMVTGASSGIGEAYAEHLAAAGWDVVLVARRLDRLEATAARLSAGHGVSVRPYEADLSDRAALEELCAEAAELQIGLLVNNAALAHYMPFVELPPERATELVELNMLAPVRLSRAVLPGMVERGAGAVINVASLLAFSGSWEGDFLPRRVMYAASKAFLLTFSQLLAEEVRPSGVRVLVVCPGLVRSEFHSRQSIDLSETPRMEPGDIVRASLLDLEHGVVVSIPAATDETGLDDLTAAELRVMGLTRTVVLPERYGPDASS